MSAVRFAYLLAIFGSQTSFAKIIPGVPLSCGSPCDEELSSARTILNGTDIIPFPAGWPLVANHVPAQQHIFADVPGVDGLAVATYVPKHSVNQGID
jgi:hypothetical protein